MDLARLGFDVDTGGLRKGQRELKGLSGQSKRTERSVGSLGRTIRNLAGALAVGAAFRTIIRNTIKQERVTAQLNQTLRSTGRFTEQLSQGLQDYASELQKVTTFGDEAIISSQALLLTFTQIGEEAFPRAQEAILDVATAMGTDLQSAAIQVGKALNDPVLGLTALQRSGIQFSETQKEIIKDMVEVGDVAGAQAIILDELETQFGGSARAARNTLGGALQSLSNAFGDLLEGKSGDGGISGATEGVNALTDTLNDPLVVAGFNTLVEGALNAIAVLSRFSAETAGFARWAAEELAAITSGAAPDDIVRLRDELETLYDMLDNPSKRIRFFGKDGAVVYYNEDEIWDMIAETGTTLVEARNELNEKLKGPGAVNAGDLVIDVPRLGSSGEDGGEGNDEASDIRQQMEKRREALLSALETEKQEVLRVYGERNAEIQELERIALEEGGLTRMQAAQLRIQNEQEKQARLTELTQEGENQRKEIERASSEERAEIQNRLNMQILGQASGFASQIAGVIKDSAGEQSSAYKAAFLAQQSFAAVSAIVNAELAAASALAPPPIGLGPVAGAPYAAVVRGMGYASAGVIAAQTLGQMESFDGGGYTGNGSRTGGMDGKGGFLAMMHPRETVVDHTKGGSTSNKSEANVTQVFQLSDNARREAKQQILESAPMIQQMAKQAVLQAINQGGAMSRAVGRRS